jgi:DNA gyrase subunit B
MLGHEEIRAMITALGAGSARKTSIRRAALRQDHPDDRRRRGRLASHLLLTFFFRHMTELIRRGHVYIAQPPLYRIKKGKFEQYIKDDREFVRVMVKRASEGMLVRVGGDGQTLEGAALTKFMGQLREYLDAFDKVDKRIRNEQVTSLLAKLELVRRSDFEGEKDQPPAKLNALHQELEAIARQYQFKAIGAPLYDEEHQTWSLSFTDSQGAQRALDWTRAASPEYRQMMSKYAQIREQLKPPFVVEFAGKSSATETEESEPESANEAGTGKAAAKRSARATQEPVTKQTPHELFEYVIEQGKREYQVQRYKGLGEMTSTQLWDTTMDPERRTLLSVKLEDIAETETIFTTLMGEDVEARRKFIEENALDVKNLDI